MNISFVYLYIVNILLDLSAERLCVGVARIGSPDQKIAVDSLSNISRWSLGGPLHSLVIIGETHPLENTMLNIVANAVKE